MERAHREIKFCLIRLPVQLQSSMTNSFQRFSRSAILEVFPKHLSYNRFTACVSAFAGSKLLPISTSISLCKAAKLVLSCLRISPIPDYKARHELEESLNLYGVKLPLKFHKQDEYIWLKYSGNNRPGHFSYLSQVSFFLRSCKVFLVCLVICCAFLINSILDNNLELSINTIKSSLGFVLAVSMALSYLQEALHELPHLNSIAEVRLKAGLSSCKEFHVVQNSWKYH